MATFTLRAGEYTFAPNTNQITFGLAGFDVRGLKAVVNVTTKADIYAAGDPTLAITTVAGSVVTFAVSMTGMAATDILFITYDDRATPQPVLQGATAAANAVLSGRVTSGASINATALKNSGGNLVEIEVYNVATALRYLKVYNKASAPAPASDTPVWMIPIPAGGGFAWSPPIPLSLATGIAYVITAGAADTDTTATAAGDVVGIVRYL